MNEGIRIYNLFPTLAGTVRDWMDHLERIAELGFNAVYINPFHYPGFSGSLYAVKDYYRLNPLFRGRETDDDDTLLSFTTAAQSRGLRVIMDLVVDHTAKDSELVARHPGWFARDASGNFVSPQAIDPADARRRTVWGDLAELDYRPPQQDEILDYFQRLVRHYVALGFGGFRCDAAYKVPAEVWRGLVDAAKAASPDVLFCAETLGAPRDSILALAGAGFDYLFNSVKWWDFESPWLLEQYETFRHIAPSIGFPESHDTKRLVTELLAAGIPEDAIERHYRQSFAFAAVYSAGVMMPMGFEYGWSRPLDVVTTRHDAPEPKRFDLSQFIAEVNAMKKAIPALNEEGPQRLLSHRDAPLLVLERQTEGGEERALILVNRHEHDSRAASLETLVDEEFVVTDLSSGRDLTVGARILVEPLEVRVLRATLTRLTFLPSARREEEGQGRGLISERLHPLWRPAARIAIEDLNPQLDGGRYPVKRVLGDEFEVQADIFRDGHAKLRAVVKFAPQGQAWRETPLTLFDNDRWIARFGLDRPGLWRYTIEAWTDQFESWRDEFEKKRQAGENTELEFVEGRAIVATMVRAGEPDDAAAIRNILRSFDGGNAARRAELMLSDELRDLSARCQQRADAVRYPRDLEIVVDRKASRFAAWYEMFPRSQGTKPGRSASFDDCIARLPEIARLGFDVVYLVPIHPIGRINRKGRNNNPVAEPGDPGSPYAIGAAEGGHSAINPELGTLDDFRRFVAAAAALGIEIALDFAIQCAPDHPWVREHAQWFRFRPDGTIKYAENPPKKYQDIVNIEFYNPDREALWEELRDIVLFWIGQGVRTFRVDNPHTKPLPFWEWLIREIKARCPEAIFLSEAFTRPKMMRALAKAGFTESYTYFTWRIGKSELIEYLTELTRGPAREYFRPNFFTNTPDILPIFLQDGGRPAFRIRLVLAATLSSVYGIYNGFELCENTPIQGSAESGASSHPEFVELYGNTPVVRREEYLNSEKYEYKVWDWDRPGNIKEDIAIVNRFRRDNPALQEFLNLRFLDSSDPDVLAYAKTATSSSNTVIIVVNLDPHAAHESEIDLPLGDFGLASDAEFSLEEAFTRRVVTCRGARQCLSLDPETNPAMIFRLLTADAA